MYKVAIISIFSLIVLAVIGTMFATSRLESAAKKTDTEITQNENVQEPDHVEDRDSDTTPTTEEEEQDEAFVPASYRDYPCKINPDCDLETEYCYKKNCSDEEGVCAEKPTACDQILSPVCSCDGKTYSSICSAQKSGASISKSGTCSSE